MFGRQGEGEASDRNLARSVYASHILEYKRRSLALVNEDLFNTTIMSGELFMNAQRTTFTEMVP